MKSWCLQYGCLECCLDTRMPLSNSDIARISDIGFSESFFIEERNGLRRLKNSLGRCVFHNGKTCFIYVYRPEGCRIYPVVLDTNKRRVVLDRNCPHYERFQITSDASRRLTRLARRLDVEKDRRLRLKR